MPIIDKITIENFKAFGTKQEIPLRKLTLVFGPNSSGKSSILQSLALMAYIHQTGSGNLHRYILGGAQVDLGGFQNFVFGRRPNSRPFLAMKLGARTRSWLCSNGDDGRVTVEHKWMIDDQPRPWSYGGDPHRIDRDHPAFGKIIEAAKSEFKRRAQDRTGDDKNPIWNDSDLDCWSKSWLDRKIQIQGTDGESFFWQTDWSNPIPEALDVEIDVLGRCLSGLNRAWKPRLGEPRVASQLDDSYEYRREEREDEEFDKWINRLIANTAGIVCGKVADGESVGTDYSFPAAERERSERIFSRILDLACVRYRGEFAFLVDVAERQLQELFAAYQYLPAFRSPPPRSVRRSFLEEGIQEHPEWSRWLELIDNHGALKRVSEWLRELVTDSRQSMSLTLRTVRETRYNRVLGRNEDNPAGGFSVDDVELAVVSPDGQIFSHLDMGSGLSPMLPLLIAMAVSGQEDQPGPVDRLWGGKKRGRVIAMEEPEQHLRPSLQASLADICLAWTMSTDHENQLILETHSELLILRILRRIRETTTGEMDDWPVALRQACPNGIRPEDVSVLYVIPAAEVNDLDHERAKVIELPVTPDGDFARPWPSGFFTERARELY